MVVTEAASGEQALQSVQDEVPSLVILDLGLPGISGWKPAGACASACRCCRC